MAFRHHGFGLPCSGRSIDLHSRRPGDGPRNKISETLSVQDCRIFGDISPDAPTVGKKRFSATGLVRRRPVPTKEVLDLRALTLRSPYVILVPIRY